MTDHESTIFFRIDISSAIAKHDESGTRWNINERPIRERAKNEKIDEMMDEINVPINMHFEYSRRYLFESIKRYSSVCTVWCDT